ncbi:hypothetical protein [Amycolatopsis australiensis]|uniref:hypothetical protein n=1 Tax=Amycolatopsis australiensis TaxID=546364 RepID=UPI000931C628|nr:hypothetical protein [Amycolatopsis australiensis]
MAPATVLAEDASAELADDIGARFRAAREKSGFAENFGALTGAGLRDRACTWTPSAHPLPAREAGDRRT